MNDLIKLIAVIAKNVGIAFLLILFAAFVSRGDSKLEKEAKRLGFTSTSETERIHDLGWHTKAQYLVDERARAQSGGFADLDELHKADRVGAASKQEYARYLREKEREEARIASQEQQQVTHRGVPSHGGSGNFPAGRYSYKSYVNSGSYACERNVTCLNRQQYQDICQNVNAVSRGMTQAWSIAALGYAEREIAGLMASGGNINSVRAEWIEPRSSSQQGGCKVYINVSGIYEGTSTRGVGETWAYEFSVNESGNTVVTMGSISPVYLGSG